MSEKVESGLEVVGYLAPSILSEHECFSRTQDQVWKVPLVRQSDAERALSERDAEIQRQRERHRTTWTQLEQVKGLLREAVGMVNGAKPDWYNTVFVALSQQAEPAPAQTEQQPVGYANFRNGRFGSWLHPTEDDAKNFDKTALAGNPAGSKQVALYAAPIAQTAPQVPERLPVEPYQTVDRSSTNYKAGWNACRKAMLEGQAAPQPEQSGLVEAVKEAVEYLDANKLNQISSGSILHVKLSAALSAVTAERDRLRGTVEDLELALQDAEERAESAGRNASAFEDRMGDLQVENGKLRDACDELRAEVERYVPLHEAVQRAAGELPEGWAIQLYIERNGGGVELIGPDGTEDFATNNERLDYTVIDALEAALDAKEE